MSKSYSFFPGCSSMTTGRAYTESFTYIAQRIGLTVDEIKDWNCCGSGVAPGADSFLAEALPARNLALSEQQYPGRPVLTLCAGCYQNLRRALVHARSGEEQQQRIEALIDRPYKATEEVINGIEVFLDEETAQAVKSEVIAPLDTMNVACYYGCMLLRPRDLCNFDDEERPSTMEQVVALSGANPVEWDFKTECCGASHQVSTAKEARPLIAQILENARLNGADAIACACPLCMLNLDMRQKQLNKTQREQGLPEFSIPIYYFTELIAASMGALPEECGITRHFTPAVELVSEAMKQGIDATLQKLDSSCEGKEES